jgi:hypothetical protein
VAEQPSPRQLVEALRAEQCARWRAGERVPAEAYLQQHPGLGADAGCALELVYQEVLLREQQGEAPHPDEYLRRFPQFAAQLAPLFEVHQGLGAALSGEVSGAPTVGPAVPPGAGAVSGPEPPAPAALGRYRLQGRLGQGGMGTVYLAHDPDLDRPVAVKVPSFDGPPERQAEQRRRFLREARAAARVRHPHVCLIYDVGEHEGQPFVVLELVRGGSLADSLRRHGRFDDCRAAVRLLLAAAGGLQAVHAAGLLHRDLKPGNILLDEGGRPLLTDFGLARAAGGGAALTADGAVLGTPAYMAPEQAFSTFGPVTARADEYGLGVVLYEVLTGRLPFEGGGLDVLRQAAHDPPPPPSQFRPDLDPALEAICLRAMARRPEDRFADVAALAAALAAWLGEGAAPAAPPRSRPAARRRGRRWALGAGLVGAALAVALLGALGWGLGPGAAPPRITALDIDTFRYQGQKAEPLGRVVVGPCNVRTGHGLHVHGQLRERAYCYLIAFSPNGKKELFSPRDPTSRPAATTAVDYPDGTLELTPQDGTGLLAVVLVASRKPLPSFEEWWGSAGAGPWRRTDDNGVWRSDGGRPVRIDGTRFKEQGGPPQPLVDLCQFVKDRPGIDAAKIVAFPAKPQD